jgi:hypothetical protein
LCWLATSSASCVCCLLHDLTRDETRLGGACARAGGGLSYQRREPPPAAIAVTQLRITFLLLRRSYSTFAIRAGSNSFLQQRRSWCSCNHRYYDSFTFARTSWRVDRSECSLCIMSNCHCKDNNGWNRLVQIPTHNHRADAYGHTSLPSRWLHPPNSSTSPARSGVCAMSLRRSRSGWHHHHGFPLIESLNSAPIIFCVADMQAQGSARAGGACTVCATRLPFFLRSPLPYGLWIYR